MDLDFPFGSVKFRHKIEIWFLVKGMSFNIKPDLFFDGLKNRDLIRSDKTDSLALHSMSSRSSHSVHIIRNCSWQMVVDHKIDLCNIESSGGEVSGHEDESLSTSESSQVVDPD